MLLDAGERVPEFQADAVERMPAIPGHDEITFVGAERSKVVRKTIVSRTR